MIEPFTNEGWRSVGPNFRSQHYNWVDYNVRKRTNEGSAEHGDSFSGDPIEHAVEEAVDMLFYLNVARKRNSALRVENELQREKINRLETEIDELRKAHRACLLASDWQVTRKEASDE